MKLSIQVKSFSFNLKQPLKTSSGEIIIKEGWLIKITDESGNIGWGEISPLKKIDIQKCKIFINSIESLNSRKKLEDYCHSCKGTIAFAIGSALAEIDERILSGNEKWYLRTKNMAYLLPNNEKIFSHISFLREKFHNNNSYLTLKIKVGLQNFDEEKIFIQKCLKYLPKKCLLRLDANSGWNRKIANYWADKFYDDPRLEWLEQPLNIDDIEGTMKLTQKVPVALDESLTKYPSLKKSWKYWQIRRPAIDGDPRLLLRELENHKPRIAISTNFETGIGSRCIHHLASMQQKTLTPAAAGLAPGWLPEDPLFSNDPFVVWEAACKN